MTASATERKPDRAQLKLAQERRRQQANEEKARQHAEAMIQESIRRVPLPQGLKVCPGPDPTAPFEFMLALYGDDNSPLPGRGLTALTMRLSLQELPEFVAEIERFIVEKFGTKIVSVQRL